MAIEFLSLDLGCGDFILTNSIAFFYSFGLTSIVTLQVFHRFLPFAIDKQGFQCYDGQEIIGKEEVHMLFLGKKRNIGRGLAPFGIAR